MTRSLYVRIVATFLLVVVLSIALAFLLTNQLFKGSRGSVAQNYDDAFERIRQLHHVVEPSSLSGFLEEIADIEDMTILAVSSKGERISVGESAEELQRRVNGFRPPGVLPWLERRGVEATNGVSANDSIEVETRGSSTGTIDESASASDFDNEYSGIRSQRETAAEADSSRPADAANSGDAADKAVPAESWTGEGSPRIWGYRSGLPPRQPSVGESIGRLVTLDGEQWSIFLQHNRYPRNSNFILTTATLLLALLAIGSVLILFAARFLVRPIKHINDAALRMSSGNFAVRLPVKRRDELGELAGSMNTMAEGLSRIESMRQDFVANVSHEIQSPLTSIHGFAEALRADDVTIEEKERYVGIIQQESSRLSKLSDNLLKLSSLDSEQHPFHPAPYRLDRQLREIILAGEPVWQRKSLRVELQAEPLALTADTELMNGVWTNLLANSIKFTPSGGAIVIAAAEEDGVILVSVRDTGPGIPLEERERVFERFYKADPSRNRSIGGSGLGLSIARKIVELHGGTIGIVTEHGGPEGEPSSSQGACFVVRLPVQE
ncbi:putative two-component sensor histidine kinase [Paenibacillus agaridevorans]|uniref:histidine kinase n=1 Tax=Paenibacillus agaridevorans TaxID=171404 RepID=A0A2R5F2X0_9BACL|nr:HAMP domain-containing sensor histidine kinase [Paenibacillus agaridevorans]GBG10251.1 putative two-component sensor histidine kinase [Paenibacillus agaridevorans]